MNSTIVGALYPKLLSNPFPRNIGDGSQNPCQQHKSFLQERNHGRVCTLDHLHICSLHPVYGSPTPTSNHQGRATFQKVSANFCN